MQEIPRIQPESWSHVLDRGVNLGRSPGGLVSPLLGVDTLETNRLFEQVEWPDLAEAVSLRREHIG